MIRNRALLTGLSPYFRPWVDLLLDFAEANGVDVTVTSAHRTLAYQEQLCTRLRTAGSSVPCATPGRSAHQYGLAVDLSSPHQTWLRAVANSIGFAPLIANDPYHYEHPDWRAMRQHLR